MLLKVKCMGFLIYIWATWSCGVNPRGKYFFLLPALVVFLRLGTVYCVVWLGRRLMEPKRVAFKAGGKQSSVGGCKNTSTQTLLMVDCPLLRLGLISRHALSCAPASGVCNNENRDVDGAETVPLQPNNSVYEKPPSPGARLGSL